MPTLDMTEALQEALAVAPSATPEIYTFEFVREGWTENVRIVYGWEEIEARLEDPSESGSSGLVVPFYPVPVDWTLEPTLPDEVPRFSFNFFDPAYLVAEKIIEQASDPKPIQMYLRVYLQGRLDLGPEMNTIPRYHVGNTNFDPYTAKVTGTCVFQDYLGRSAPFKTYTLAEFPGLRRR